MTDLIRREDAVKACRELCIDGPTDALDTGRNFGIGKCVVALRSLPEFEPAGPTEEEVAQEIAVIPVIAELRLEKRLQFAKGAARVAIEMLRGKM